MAPFSNRNLATNAEFSVQEVQSMGSTHCFRLVLPYERLAPRGISEFSIMLQYCYMAMDWRNVVLSLGIHVSTLIQ